MFAIIGFGCKKADPFVAGNPVKQTYSINTINFQALNYGKDGMFGFSNRGKMYLVGGWNGGNMPTTDNEQWVSLDDGYTWSRIKNAPFRRRHTVASETVNDKNYIVGGDYYNYIYYKRYQKDSWVFDNGNWTQISKSTGIGNRVLAELVFLNGLFYLIGGQVSLSPGDGVYTSVLMSKDSCATFEKIGDTPFADGNLWGAVAAFNGKIWKIGGGIYSDNLDQRTYPKEIYSSPDGINWTMEGIFPGKGRSYAQLVVFNKKLWLIHGFNHREGNNLNDTWFTYDGINWVKSALNDTHSRHAHSAWADSRHLYWAGGSSNEWPYYLSDVVRQSHESLIKTQE